MGEKSEYLHKESCPKCGSGNNLARYSDGSAYCFTPGCGYRERAGAEGGEALPQSKSRRAKRNHALIGRNGSVYDKPISSRGIDCDTLRRFGYFPTKLDGKVVHVAPYFDETGTEVAQKVRLVEEKDFFVASLPDVDFLQLWLFGRQVWGDGSHKKVAGSNYISRVLVVEGEIDTMTVAQVTRFKLPVVSVNSGAGNAKKSLAANIDWLMKFDEVLLGFDADEPGKKALDECVGLFPIGKVRIVTWPGKDPNELLKAKRPGDIVTAIETASLWSPPGTITGNGLFRLIQDAADENLAPPLTFPWPHMQKATAGAYRRNDVTVLVAGSGVGKTTLLCECMAHWLDEGDVVGAIFLEDLPIDVVDGLLTIATDQRLRLDPKLVPAPAKIEALKAKGWADRLFIEEPDKITKTKEALFSKVRYLVGNRGVTILIVDPLSFLVSKSVTDHDERRAIDHLMTELSDLCRSLSVTLILSHHLSRPDGDRGHEEGAHISLKHVRGSHGIVMYAANVLGIEAPDVREGEIAAKVIVLKARRRGELRGRTVSNILFDEKTGRLREVPPKFGQQAMDATLEDDTFADKEAGF